MRFRFRSTFLLALAATSVAGALLFGSAALAQPQIKKPAPPPPIELEIPVPISTTVEGYADGKVQDLANYINVVYQFIISIVGLVAAVMMIIGGFQYLTSGGDAGKVGAAKKRITDALIGLVLALSAYALLNTINPALLQFRPLWIGIAKVGTELSFMPWCEELAAKGTTVTKVGSLSGCGNIGSYPQDPKKQPDPKNPDANKQYCVYYGDCRMKTVVYAPNPSAFLPFVFPEITTCLQKQGLTSNTIAEAIKKDKEAPLGACLPCWIITTTAAKELGYSPEAACSAWQFTANDFLAKDDPNQFVWTYCAKAGKFPSCVQADVNCKKVNDNPDKSESDCTKDSHFCGCEGYDDSPEPAWAENDHTLKEVLSYKPGTDKPPRGESTLDDLPQHISAVCEQNPCVNFRDTRVAEGAQTKETTMGTIFNPLPITTIHTATQQAFKNGCSGAGASQFVAGARMVTSDCRNKK